MSVIAFDGEIIAADTGCYHEGNIGTAHKLIMKKKDGFKGVIYGITGIFYCFDPLIEWHENGAELDKFPKLDEDDSFTFIVVKNKTIYLYCGGKYKFELIDSIDAWGSGGDIAIGAMLAGESSIDAVRIASSKDAYCDISNAGIDSFDINET